MGDATKSLAAEIEAVLVKRLHVSLTPAAGGPSARIVGIPEAAAEIAALQSRAFEDGARWMRERAADRVKDRAYLMEHGEEQAAVLRAASDLAALPLQPEGERNA